MECTHLVLALPLALAALGCAQPRAGEPAADPQAHFRVDGDGTATDLSTGLTWQRCPVGSSLDDAGTPGVLPDDRCRPSGAQTFSWRAAWLAVQQLNARGGRAGFVDWRVPSLAELASIVAKRPGGPAVDARVFPDTPRSLFLSETPADPWRGRVWAVDFLSGEERAQPTVTTLHLRLVRSARHVGPSQEGSPRPDPGLERVAGGAAGHLAGAVPDHCHDGRNPR